MVLEEMIFNVLVPTLQRVDDRRRWYVRGIFNPRLPPPSHTTSTFRITPSVTRVTGAGVGSPANKQQGRTVRCVGEHESITGRKIRSIRAGHSTSTVDVRRIVKGTGRCRSRRRWYGDNVTTESDRHCLAVLELEALARPFRSRVRFCSTPTAATRFVVFLFSTY